MWSRASMEFSRIEGVVKSDSILDVWLTAFKPYPSLFPFCHTSGQTHKDASVSLPWHQHEVQITQTLASFETLISAPSFNHNMLILHSAEQNTWWDQPELFLALFSPFFLFFWRSLIYLLGFMMMFLAQISPLSLGHLYPDKFTIPNFTVQI